MGYKEIQILICDDCMNTELSQEERLIYKRHCAYFLSALMTTGLCVMMWYWVWIVLKELPDNEEFMRNSE